MEYINDTNITQSVPTVVTLGNFDGLHQGHQALIRLTKQIAEQENITEQLKSDNAMLWIQKMNEIQSRVREIIYSKIIYA